MTDQPAEEARLSALLGPSGPPELPDRLSAQALWQEAASRKEPHVTSLRSYFRTEGGAPADFSLIIQAAG